MSKKQQSEADSTEIIQGSKGEEIDRFLQEMETAQFTGAVLVKQAGEVILSKGYGQANQSIPNTSSTIFHVASVTKQFTAAAVMLLVEEGKIHLNDSINSCLSTRYDNEEWEDITVEHLLTHTSGIPNYAEWDDYWEICKHLTVDKVICDVREQELLFPPGTECCYSNTGYTLLGKIIEKQGNMPYRDFIKKRLLIPAGMMSSGIHDKSCVPPADCSAVGFCVENQKLVKDRRDEFSVLYSDGGLYSTVWDMAKWNDVLDGKTTVLSRSSIKRMIEREYGLMVDHAFGHRRIHHNGSMAGFRADFCKYPDEDIFIVILGNNADFVVEYLTSQLAQLLLYTPRFSLPHLISFPTNFNDAPYFKTFESHRDEEDSETYTFKRRHHQLFLQGEDFEAQCFLLSNQHLFVPTEGQELELRGNGEIYVYNEDGQKEDIWSPPSILENIWDWLRSVFRI